MKLLYYYIIGINIVTFLLYGIDKWKARHNKWRISEAMLLMTAFLGGSPGALAGMYGFHHKTRHKQFAIGVPVMLVIHLGLLWWLLQ